MRTSPLIGMLGTGNMGQAILAGIIAARIVRKNKIICFDLDPFLRRRVSARHGVRFAKSAAEVAGRAHIIILAVKPQDALSLFQSISASIRPSTWVVSVMAGVEIESIRDNLHLKMSTRIIRTMPNLACLVQRGVIGIYGSALKQRSSHPVIRLITKLFQTVGKIVRLSKEKDLDLFTAIGGSGPGFMAYLMEVLAEEAGRMTISKADTRDIIIQMVSGTCDYLRATGIEPAELRRRVSSKGGSTLAGLKAMRKARLRPAIKIGIRVAEKRARARANLIRRGK